MIGIAGMGTGISHIFFAEKITRSIGLKSSPYQLRLFYEISALGL